MNPDDPPHDDDEDFDPEALRRRRREQFGGQGLPSPPPSEASPAPSKKAPASKPKRPARSTAKPTTATSKPASRQPARKAPSRPPPSAQPAARPLGDAAFPELGSLGDALSSTPQARADAEVAPSTLNRSLLPTAEPPPRVRISPPHDGSSGPRPSSILIILGAICIAVFVVLQVVHGSGTSTSNTSGPAASTPATTSPPSSGTTTPPATSTPTTPPAPPTVRWTHAVSLSLNNPMTFSSYPPTSTPSFGHGLEVNSSGGTTMLVADGQGDSVAQWTGHGPPSASDCAGIAGSDRVELGGGGVPIGGWICAHSGSDDLRLKYLSGSTSLVSSSYGFLVTVWNTGGSG